MYGNSPSIMSGWLKKRKQKDNLILPNWSKRWVSVHKDRILWRHAKDIELAGILEFQHVESVYKVEILDGSSNKGQVFVVKSRKKTICFMAHSEAECERWVRSIQLQLDLRNGGTSQGPPSAKNRRKSNGGGNHFEVTWFPTLNDNLFVYHYIITSIDCVIRRSC
jgi:hypothetical protein